MVNAAHCHVNAESKCSEADYRIKYHDKKLRLKFNAVTVFEVVELIKIGPSQIWP